MEEGPVIVPRLLLDVVTEHVHLMTNIFYRARVVHFSPGQSNTLPSALRVGDEAGASVALAVFLHGTSLRMISEARFATRVDRWFSADNTQLEFDLGLEWLHETGVAIGVGIGLGPLEGSGQPLWRGIVSVGYQPEAYSQDVHARAPEAGLWPPLTPDTSEPGVSEPVTRPPARRPPVVGDSVLAEVSDDAGGSARDLSRDSDGDGIFDVVDRCPHSAEDQDGFQDRDGCPDLDNDGDGIPDARDDCPLEAEDADGVRDGDGCPDHDNDADGVPDSVDKCPLKPEDLDGCDDEDGCPEDSPICVQADRIVLMERLQFRRSSAKLKTASYGILAKLAQVLVKNTSIGVVEIQGHWDSKGSETRNVSRSEARAKAVYEHLVRGLDVPASQLRFRGLGEDEPVDDNGTREGRANNRRIEFVRVGDGS